MYTRAGLDSCSCGSGNRRPTCSSSRATMRSRPRSHIRRVFYVQRILHCNVYCIAMHKHCNHAQALNPPFIASLTHLSSDSSTTLFSRSVIPFRWPNHCDGWSRCKGQALEREQRLLLRDVPGPHQLGDRHPLHRCVRARDDASE